MADDVLDDVRRFVCDDLAAVDRLMDDAMASDSCRVGEVAAHLRRVRGKRVRPMLTLLTARAFGPAEAARPICEAAALEAIHVATLLHDDVIDGAATRRGEPSVHRLWGDPTAILMADYIFAATFQMCLARLSADAMGVICRATQTMCEGEMLQIERDDAAHPTQARYLDAIDRKTASLFSACTHLAALCVGLAGDDTARLAAFGRELGLAFQIADDMLDYIADDPRWGKRVGMDLAAGRPTLPLILAFERVSSAERRRLDAALKNTGDAGDGDFDTVRGILNGCGAIEAAGDAARDHVRRAIDGIAPLTIHDRAAHDRLTRLAGRLVERGY